MEAFPFTEAEWAPVCEAARAVLNATFAADDVLQASHLEGLLEVLAGLRSRFGDHPKLLETEADFIEDDAERAVLYRRAARIAEVNNLPTLSIRLSLAEVLLDMGEPGGALTELRACVAELGGADDSKQKSWAELIAAASQARTGPT